MFEEKTLAVEYKHFGNGLYAEMMKCHKDESWEIWVGHMDYGVKKLVRGYADRESAEVDFNLLMLLDDLAMFVNEEFGR